MAEHRSRQRLNKILSGYLSEVEAGQTPDRQELLQQNPDLADSLTSFFQIQDEVELSAAAQQARQSEPMVPPETSDQNKQQEANDYEDRATVVGDLASEIRPQISQDGEDIVEAELSVAGAGSLFGDYLLISEIARGGMGFLMHMMLRRTKFATTISSKSGTTTVADRIKK